MIAIDWARLVTAGDRAEALQDARRTAAAAECARRILAVADEVAQRNLAAAAAAGLLSPADLEVYRSGLIWVAAMRARHPALAADRQADLAAEAAWPALPEGIAALAARF